MADNNTNPAPAKAAKKARVIADQGEHRINDLVTGAEAEAGIEAGWADGSAGAVAHAEKLARQRARAAEDVAE